MDRYSLFFFSLKRAYCGRWCKYDEATQIINALKAENKKLQDRNKKCLLECESKAKEIDAMNLSNLTPPCISDHLTDSHETPEVNPSAVIIVIGLFAILAVTITVW